MAHESVQEDVQPLHPANMRAIPSADARVTLMNLPKEQAHLNGLNAVVLSQAAAKSSSGAVKVFTQALNPKPYTLNPKPYTLNPKPKTAAAG